MKDKTLRVTFSLGFFYFVLNSTWLKLEGKRYMEAMSDEHLRNVLLKLRISKGYNMLHRHMLRVIR